MSRPEQQSNPVHAATAPSFASVGAVRAGALFKKADWIAFAVTVVISMAVYAFSQAPTVTLEDSGELVVAADHLGVPHPPGYPLWAILGWLFARIFSFVHYLGHSNPAWGVNFMSGFFGSLGCGLAALLISRTGLDLLHTIRSQEESGQPPWMEQLISCSSGIAAGLVLAFCPFIWSQCVIAEVYSLNMFLHLLILTLAYLWMQRPHDNRPLYWLAFVFGVAFTNCQPVILIVPALMVMIFAVDRALFRDSLALGAVILGAWAFLRLYYPDIVFFGPGLKKETAILLGITLFLVPIGIWFFTRALFTEWKRLLFVLLFAALGLSLFVYMPIASDYNPPMNWGYPRTWEGFKHATMRGQYQALAPALTPTTFFNQTVEFLSELEDQFPFPLPLLALVPIFYFRQIWRRNWGWLAGTLIAFVIAGPGMMVLLNPPHDVQSLFIAQVQFVQSTAFYALWVGYGFLLGLVFVGKVLKYRAVLIAAIALVLLTPLSLIWQNTYDEKMIEVSGSSDLRGHDFGWQFGHYQLRGINGIMEELQPGEMPPPNPKYPPEMGTNAIFFGGTDPGRFVPTYMIYSGGVRPDVYLITQNALADNTYMNVMRDLYGDRIWMPSAQDSNVAFQQYVADVHAGRMPPSANVTVDPNGRVSVQGVQGVMEINGLICKMIFEANKSKHDFYVEESYVIAWMYPYLEPHGLIMKINPEPMPKLSDAVVTNDMEFWNWYNNRLMNNPKFLRDVVARKTFSKLRCALAGVYGFRRMFNEAETAFRQAVNLYPLSPEANFRLSDLYLQQGRFADAVKVMEQNKKLDPKNDKIAGFISQIKELQQLNARIMQLQSQLAGGTGTLDMVFELANIFIKTGKEQPFLDIARQLLGDTNLPPMAYLKVAELCASPQPRFGMMEEAFQKYLQREPSDPRIWMELAGVQTALNQPERAIQSVRKAVNLGGEPIKDFARKDQRLTPLRNNEAFQKMIAPSQQGLMPFSGNFIP